MVCIKLKYMKLQKNISHIFIKRNFIEDMLTRCFWQMAKGIAKVSSENRCDKMEMLYLDIFTRA